MRYKTLAFDLAGTVFDWKGSIKRVLETVTADQGIVIDSERFAMAWRKHMVLALLEVRSTTLPHMHVNTLLPIALQRIAMQFPALKLDDDVIETLLSAWYGMRAWDDVPVALARMKDTYPVIAFSVLNFSMISECSRASGISWDGIISCDLLNSYKPEPEAYMEASAIIGARPDEVCLVSSHHADLVAARSVGMGTAYCFPHLAEPGTPAFNLPGLPSADEYDYCASSFEELADMLCHSWDENLSVA
jgi:2-haloacid dehalogenase